MSDHNTLADLFNDGTYDTPAAPAPAPINGASIADRMALIDAATVAAQQDEAPNWQDTPYRIMGKQATKPRGWLYGRHLLRSRVSATYAPGAVGKTALVISEALAMATGRKLMGKWVHKPMKVFYWNLEDPMSELALRIEAACDHFGITAADIGDRLTVWDCEHKLKLVKMQPLVGLTDNHEDIDSLRRFIAANKFQVMTLDPLIELHDADENNNVAMKMVLGHIRDIAVETRCAASVNHHTRKVSGAEITADDGRGASSVTGLCRDVRVLNQMTKEEAEAVCIPIKDRKRYVSYVSDKGNAAVPPECKDWFRLVSIDMDNATDEDDSESVGVAVPFSYEDAKPKISGADVLRCQHALQDAYDRGEPGRKHHGADAWAGYIIAHTLGMDATAKSPERPAVLKMLKDWLANGALVIEDDWKDANGDKRPVVIVGQWAVED